MKIKDLLNLIISNSNNLNEKIYDLEELLNLIDNKDWNKEFDELNETISQLENNIKVMKENHKYKIEKIKDQYEK